MPKADESAAACWEVDRRASGQMPRPYCVVILRDKKAGRSVVKASSSDFDSMKKYAEQLSEDLYTLTNEEFVKRYNLGAV
ncbi:MAG: hypothetical protein ACYC2Y_01820 [Armatimonadota bacterium]